MTTKTPTPLSNLLILDLTRILAGPYTTMLLSDLGARVIKVEPPGGDDARRFGPFVDGKSTYFESVNRGKESIALDLRDDADRAIFEKLVARADVLVENFRAGALGRLGYGFAELQKLNARLVVAAISGFGQTGPYRELPAYDLIAQALGGIISITGSPGAPPVRIGTSIGDIAAGLFGVSGILAALLAREKSGAGALVDVAMLDCQVAILENAIGRRLSSGESPSPLGLRHPSITPFDGFKVGDEYLIIAAGNDNLFKKLCASIGADELASRDEFLSNDLRTQNHAALKLELEKLLAAKPLAEWLKILRAAGIPCAPINDMDGVINDEQVNARNMIINALGEDGRRMRMAGNPVKVSGFDDPQTRMAAPELDGNRDAVLDLLK